MHCDTAYGDYPTLLATGEFAEWMLLNYGKPVRASSSLAAFPPNNAVDENIRTYWSAQSGDAGEWFESDLSEASSVMAIQLNFADQDAEFMGKLSGISHRHRILSSLDGSKWEVIVDQSENSFDVPHEYIEFPDPLTTRFIRVECVHMPTGKFALSGLRVFGRSNRPLPASVEDFVVLRGESERRNAWIKWRASADATGTWSGAELPLTTCTRVRWWSDHPKPNSGPCTAIEPTTFRSRHTMKVALEANGADTDQVTDYGLPSPNARPPDGSHVGAPSGQGKIYCRADYRIQPHCCSVKAHGAIVRYEASVWTFG